MADQKATDQEIIDLLVEGNLTRRAMASKLGITDRRLRTRIKNMRQDGRINADQFLPVQFPGMGREITKVTSHTDKFGDVVGQHITEKPSYGEHTPIIDAPIVRQSRYTGKDGEVIGQWDIRVPDATQEAMEALIEGIKATITPLPPQAQQQHSLTGQLRNQYVFSDVHIGLMADVDTETGLEHTEDLIARTFELMVQRSLMSTSATIVILGDWFHFDSLLPLTVASKNVLFANAHFPQMVRSGLKIMRRLITAALFKHHSVEVVIAEGNHDPASSLWMRELFKILYENETRVSFVETDTPFSASVFGDTFLGYHHGHVKTIKNSKDLAIIFAALYPKMWGDTTKRYIHTGHLHHSEEKEEGGVYIRQHPTLAKTDNYARRHAFLGQGAAIATTYSDRYGEVSRTYVTPEMMMLS